MHDPAAAQLPAMREGVDRPARAPMVPSDRVCDDQKKKTWFQGGVAVGLILTLRKRDDFFLGDERFVVEDIDSLFNVTISDQKGKKTVINIDGITPIRPRVGAMISETGSGQVKVMFEAPRSLAILTGANYRR